MPLAATDTVTGPALVAALSSLSRKVAVNTAGAASFTCTPAASPSASAGGASATVRTSSSAMVPLPLSSPVAPLNVTSPAASPLANPAAVSSPRVTITVSAASFRSSWLMPRSIVPWFIAAPAAIVTISCAGVV